MSKGNKRDLPLLYRLNNSFELKQFLTWQNVNKWHPTAQTIFWVKRRKLTTEKPPHALFLH